MKYTGAFRKAIIKIVTLMTAIFFIINAHSCKKDEDLLVQNKLLGYWELESLIIDGIDTTYSIKADSNCYGWTRFYLTEFKTIRMKQVPYYNNYSTSFHCLTDGYSLYVGQLVLQWATGSNNVGPYLSDERLYWNIVEISNSNMKLQIDYHGLPCSLTLKKYYN